MSEALQATLERIAEQQEANTAAIAALAERQVSIAEQQKANSTAIAALAERQSQTDSAIARLLQMTERLAPQVIENTERINSLSTNA
ncbi:MAG: hypothetical protein F6K31_29520 [Symploca sp. SIO2G7]|nr:hypothetical protein [Symploca sp. SIO2G7]